MAKKILVVDDEKDVRSYFSALLGDAGFETVVAADGVEGMNKVHAESPDLVVLDLTMPEGSGARMYAEMKNEDALLPIPVLVVTGIQGELDELLPGGAKIPPPDELITRPFDEGELMDKIGKLAG